LIFDPVGTAGRVFGYSGAQSFETFTRVIDDELARAANGAQ